MHARRVILIGAGLWVTGLSAIAADLSVVFLHPQKYVDAGYSRPFASEAERAAVQRDIEQHFQRLAERHLAVGDSLKIEVLDIDLAGHFEPLGLRNGTDLRVVRGVTWPRIKLRYVFSRGGQVVARGEEQVSDKSFLMGGNRYPSSDRLRYEKAMLDDWFERLVAKRRQG